MDYETAVRQTWQHHPFRGDASDLRALVRYAVLAASSHNTQPWKFDLRDRRISVRPDLSRRCPEVDPDDHHLFASLGCAVENLVLASQAAGLHAEVRIDPSSGAHVDLSRAPASRSALFRAIPRRQCSRSQYDGTALSASETALLGRAGEGRGVSVIFLTAKGQKEQVAEYVAEGNAAQIGDPRWVEELGKWVRFNAREAVSTGDGLYGRVMGAPDAPRWIGRRLMPLTLSAGRQSRKDARNIRSSSGIAVFVSDLDDRTHWIEAGRCFQRFALQATALGLRTAFVNQPVEVPALRRQFAGFLGVGDGRPDLVVRFGRGPEMPRSLRRPIEDVLLPA